MNIVPNPLKMNFNGEFCKNNKMYAAYLTDDMEEEEYTLEIAEGKTVTARGGSEKALFYAKKTFEQICFQYKDKLPVCKIYDKPEYKYRGFMIDCARHIFSIEDLKKIIDAMAMFKFNVFHWHLTDDQGWRIEIDKYPLLADKAGIRKFSNFGKEKDKRPYGKVYSKAEMKEIVAFCKSRFIDVVPEFDIPGHTSALLSVFPELTCSGEPVMVKTRQGIYKDVVCPAKTASYTVIEDILTELTEIFPFEIYHIGGDEVPPDQWESCEDCKRLMQKKGITSMADYHNFFMNRIIEFLSEKGKKCIVWNDTMKGSRLDKRAIVQYWKENDKGTVDYANHGGEIILSPFSSYYMDYDYDIIPLGRTYKFNPRLRGLTDNGAANILGVEAPIWTEYIDNSLQMQKMLFPRMLAVACTGWESNKESYKNFLERTETAVGILKQRGIYAMPKARWNYSRLAMPAGWLRFVAQHYTFDYIKSCLK